MMLHFEESYFEKEDRCEFTISETMKHAWAAQLEVLVKIIEICEKYNLTYYAAWGTLLGAIRHEGFIPWDDDMDIAFLREDYEKFFQVAAKELPSEFGVLTMYTEEEWNSFFGRITNSRVIDVSQKRLEEYHGCPFIVGVDIYPLDNIPTDEALAAEQKEVLTIVKNVLTLQDYKEKLEASDNQGEVIGQLDEAIGSSILALEKYSGIIFTANKSIRNQLYQVMDKVAKKYTNVKSDMVACIPNYMRRNLIFRKEWFDRTVYKKFENIEIAVPIGCEELLNIIYRDFRTPRVFKRAKYPFYKEQLQMLKDRGLWLDVEE